MEYYTLKLCGLTRKLPLARISKNTSLASFSILGDVELVDRVADRLIEKLQTLSFDYLVGPEVRVVPLIHEIAKRLNHKRFVICRQQVRSYMVSPIIVKPLPFFPKHVQPLVIDGPDALLLKNKKVAIIDDVISTGVTLRMIKKLMEKVNAKITATAAIIQQGEPFNPLPDLIYLGHLPIFKTPPPNSNEH